MTLKIIIGYCLDKENRNIKDLFKALENLKLDGISYDFLFLTKGSLVEMENELDAFCKLKKAEGNNVYIDNSFDGFETWYSEKHIVENIEPLQALYKTVSIAFPYEYFIFVKDDKFIITADLVDSLLKQEKNIICSLDEKRENGVQRAICVLRKKIKDFYFPADKSFFKENLTVLMAGIFKLLEVGKLELENKKYIKYDGYSNFPIVDFIDLAEKTEKEVMRQWIKYDDLQKIVNNQKKALHSGDIDAFNRLLEEKNNFLSQLNQIETNSAQMCNRINEFFDLIDGGQLYDPSLVSKILGGYLDEKSKKLNMLFDNIRKQVELIAKSEQDLNRLVAEVSKR